MASRREWEQFFKETKFIGYPFVTAAFVNKSIYANTLVDTGNQTYGIIDAHFCKKNHIERIKIRPFKLRGFDGPSDDHVTEVAKMALDIGGHMQDYVYLYVVPKIDQHDMILGIPWLQHQNVVVLPDRSKIVFRNTGIEVACGMGLANEAAIRKKLGVAPISAEAFQLWCRKRGKGKVKIFAISL